MGRPPQSIWGKTGNSRRRIIGRLVVPLDDRSMRQLLWCLALELGFCSAFIEPSGTQVIAIVHALVVSGLLRRRAVI